ncbi:hypothetical protein Tco_0522285 [Tanacetum coccineum]
MYGVKGLRKEALNNLDRNGSILLSESNVDANIDDDIMDPVMAIPTISHPFGFLSKEIVSLSRSYHTTSIDFLIRTVTKVPTHYPCDSALNIQSDTLYDLAMLLYEFKLVSTGKEPMCDVYVESQLVPGKGIDDLIRKDSNYLIPLLSVVSALTKLR